MVRITACLNDHLTVELTAWWNHFMLWNCLNDELSLLIVYCLTDFSTGLEGDWLNHDICRVTEDSCKLERFLYILLGNVQFYVLLISKISVIQITGWLLYLLNGIYQTHASTHDQRSEVWSSSKVLHMFYQGLIQTKLSKVQGCWAVWEDTTVKASVFLAEEEQHCCPMTHLQKVCKVFLLPCWCSLLGSRFWLRKQATRNSVFQLFLVLCDSTFCDTEKLPLEVT